MANKTNDKCQKIIVLKFHCKDFFKKRFNFAYFMTKTILFDKIDSILSL